MKIHEYYLYKKITQKFVEDFQYMDVVLVSGLAYGTDINAQKECIKFNIPTISVYAHGRVPITHY